jgi:hypothetical protein
MEWNNVGKVTLYDLNGVKLAECDGINSICFDKKVDENSLLQAQIVNSFELILNFNHMVAHKPRQSKRYKKNRNGFR